MLRYDWLTDDFEISINSVRFRIVFSQHWNTDDENLTTWYVGLCHDEVQVLLEILNSKLPWFWWNFKARNNESPCCSWQASQQHYRDGKKKQSLGCLSRWGIQQPVICIFDHPCKCWAMLVFMHLNTKNNLRHVEGLTIRLRYGFLDFFRGVGFNIMY